MDEQTYLKKRVQTEVDAIMPKLKELRDKIGHYPELGSEEYKSSNLLVQELEKHGFQVEYPFFDMDTAFKASYKGVDGGPVIAILCEYDALPGVGHGCGHNIIDTAGIGAGIAVSKVIKDLSGELWVIGTPAEEGHGPYGGAKVKMVEGGVFEDVDVSYMIHPSTGPTMVSGNFLAIKGIIIEFKGKTSHAAVDTHEGINALNAAVITYMAIHANRQQLRRDANAVVHGIIKEGGLASNVIPDKAVLQFGVRSSDDKYLPTLLEMVKNSAQGAAIATGCGVSFIESEGLKSNLRNCGLENLFQRIFQELNWSCEDPTETALRPPSGSTDFADVSHVVAGIHPMIGIHTADIPMHSREFAGVTFTPEGDKGLEIGAKAMAMVTVELMASPYLVKEIRREFESKCQ